LSITDWGKPFNIHTDAMVAGILSQTGEDGNKHPTAFYSKKLNDNQRVWSTIEKEAFAVLEALNRFDHGFMAIKFSFIRTIIHYHT